MRISRWFVLPLLLVVLWVMAIAGARWIGGRLLVDDLRAQPGFAACDLPCWAGVVPGITLFGAIPDQVRAGAPDVDWQFQQGVNNMRLVGHGQGTRISGSIMYDRGRAGELLLTMGDVSLAALMQALDTPHCAHVSVVRGGYSAAVVWLNEDHLISGRLHLAHSGEWGPDARVLHLTSAAGVNWCSWAKSWTGFAPLWWYSDTY